MCSNLAAISLLIGLLVVKRLIPLHLCLPSILQNSAEDCFKQQNTQVDDEKCIHGPAQERQDTWPFEGVAIPKLRGNVNRHDEMHTSLLLSASGICTCSSVPSWIPFLYTPPHLHNITFPQTSKCHQNTSTIHNTRDKHN